MLRKVGFLFALMLTLPAIANAWTLAAKVSGSAGSIVVGADTVTVGSKYITVAGAASATIAANAGYKVALVTVDGVKATPVDGVVSITAPVAPKTTRSVVAYFSPETFTVTVNQSASGGTVVAQMLNAAGTKAIGSISRTAIANIPAGGKVKITALPNSDSKAVTVAGTDFSGTALAGVPNSVTVTVSANASYGATFSVVPILTANLVALSTDLKPIGQSITAGTTVKVDASGSRSNGAIAYAWSGTCGAAGTASSVEIAPASNCTVTVTTTSGTASKSASLNFTVLTAQQAANGTCVACHTTRNPATVAGYGTTHSDGSVSCATCHSTHGVTSATLSLKALPSAVVADAQNFVGANACSNCHNNIHTEWSNSFHTMKATYGPAFPGFAGGTANIHPWVVTNWNTLTNANVNQKLLPHAVLDTKANPAGAPAGYKEVYITKDAYSYNDVAIVVGQTRKQRYAIYDGGALRTEAWVAYSLNDGIRWDIKTVAADVAQTSTDPVYKRDNSGGTPTVVSFPGNKSRAGYKFLMIEVDLGKTTPEPKTDKYGEYKSWQEKCIACHTTGFNMGLWNAAKTAYVGGTGDLTGIYVNDNRIACEACHGPGNSHATTGDKNLIVRPAQLTGEAKAMICQQCHTRAKSVVEPSGAEDRRAAITTIPTTYASVYTFTAPAWGSGNRQVSIDGKGRRDHQQDMDILLSNYILKTVKGKTFSYHGGQSCSDCHTSHAVGSNKTLSAGSRADLKVANDPDGLIRLKDTRDALCYNCHVTNPTAESVGLPTGTVIPQYASVAALLNKFDGGKGYASWAYGWTWGSASNWGTLGGRDSKNQHLFNGDFDASGYPVGLTENEYTWEIADAKAGTLTTVIGDYKAIWPWLAASSGKTKVYGPITNLGVKPPLATRPYLP